MKNVLMGMAIMLALITVGCQNSTPSVDKGKIDNLARKVLNAITSEKPEEIYNESFTSEYKQRLSEKEWVEMAKAYALRLGAMTDMARISTNIVEINGTLEAAVKYDVTWEKAPGWLEISLSKDADGPWKIVKIIIRSDAISEKATPPSIEKVEAKAEKIIKEDIKIPTGDDTLPKGIPTTE